MLVGQATAAPELVIGLVSPIGTELDQVAAALQEALRVVHYDSDVVRLSLLLKDTPVPDARQLPGRDDPDYYGKHMDAGDELRELFQSGDVLAGYAIERIRGSRKQATGDPTGQGRRYATILHSLKHDEEVKLLRATYRKRFILLGVSASLELRTKSLEARLADQGARFSQAVGSPSEMAVNLLERDEDDPKNDFGQHVRKTFAKADAFLWQSGDAEDLVRQATRFIELLFGKPFLTPTRDELAMFHARAAALRSADAGRQVGVAITSRDGELLVTGTNEVPKPGGGQYWAEDPGDARDFRKLQDTNKRLTRRLIADVLQRLKADGWLSSKFRRHGREDLLRDALIEAEGETKAGPLESARITDLLEFSRVVHAEMGAICEAAARGVAIAGTTLYTTTYPCHLCARLIIAAGVVRLVYIDPYGKSVVPELFGDQVRVGGSDETQPVGPDGSVSWVLFTAFAGVAPSLFDTVFSASGREVDAAGAYPSWEPVAALPRIADNETLIDANILESDVVDALHAREKEVRRAQRAKMRALGVANRTASSGAATNKGAAMATRKASMARAGPKRTRSSGN